MKNVIVKIYSEDNEELSEEQKMFNALVQKVEKKKKELSRWEAIVDEYRIKNAQEIAPLINELYKYKKNIIMLFDARLEDTRFTNGERRKLKDFVYHMSMDMLDERHDEDIEHIYEKYKKPIKQKPTMFDEVMEELSHKMREKMEERFNEWKEGRIGDEGDEVNEESDLEKVSKESIKDVYKNLATMLHPDKEKDEKEKERKTKLMQQINKMYKERNLSELLRVELEEAKIHRLNSEKLSQKNVEGFNEALKRELESLRDKIYLSKRYFQVAFNGIKISALSHKRIKILFQKEVEYLSSTILDAKNDLNKFRNDAKTVRKFAKSIKIQPSHNELYDLF